MNNTKTVSEKGYMFGQDGYAVGSDSIVVGFTAEELKIIDKLFKLGIITGGINHYNYEYILKRLDKRIIKLLEE